MSLPAFRCLEEFVGHTPLVRLKRLPGDSSNVVLLKLEGNNPAGSVKDRPALNMIRAAEARGDIRPGDTLVEPTIGNTGIALAMAAAVMGYRMILVMPENSSTERVDTMRAYGAEVVLTPAAASMPGAIDEARRLCATEGAVMLDQFANLDNPAAHMAGTGPEIWADTAGSVTHFVSSMGTTGTIMGTGRYLKSRNPEVQVIGVQPASGSQIPGIRKWEAPYVPGICRFEEIDELQYVTQQEAEDTTRRLAREEGILAGPSSGGALAVALRLNAVLSGAVIVSIVCDRGDRYLSTGLFSG